MPDQLLFVRTLDIKIKHDTTNLVHREFQSWYGFSGWLGSSQEQPHKPI